MKIRIKVLLRFLLSFLIFTQSIYAQSEFNEHQFALEFQRSSKELMSNDLNAQKKEELFTRIRLAVRHLSPEQKIRYIDVLKAELLRAKKLLENDKTDPEAVALLFAILLSGSFLGAYVGNDEVPDRNKAKAMIGFVIGVVAGVIYMVNRPDALTAKFKDIDKSLDNLRVSYEDEMKAQKL